MYLNVLDYILQNLSRRWRLHLPGATLEGHFDRNQFQQLKGLKTEGQLDQIIRTKFVVFRTSQPCIVNVEEIGVMHPE